MKNKKKGPKGAALLATVIVIMTVILASGVAMMSWARQGYKYAVRKTEDSRAFYIADSGIRYATKQIIGNSSHSGLDLESISNDFMQISSSFIPNNKFKITNYSLSETVTNGVNPYGIDEVFILEKLYTVCCRVENIETPANYSEVTCQLGDFSVSLFKFGLYYQDMEMEIYPGSKEMRIGGRTHSNKGMYLGPQNCIRFLGKVTSADGIYHGGIPGKDKGWGTRRGHIYIPPEEEKIGFSYDYEDTDGDGVDEAYLDMRTNYWSYIYTNKYGKIRTARVAEFLDSTDPEWGVKSTEFWGENSQTKEHDISTIALPFDNALENTRILVDPDPMTNGSYEIAKSRLENVAGLVLSPEGNLYEQTGVITNKEYTTRVFLANVTNLNWITTTNQFFNRRNMGHYTDNPTNGMVYPTDIDIGKMGIWLAAQGTLSFTDSDSERAGVFYVHRSNTLGRAVRLGNAEELFDTSAGITIATPNPIYTWGNYNTHVGGSSGSNLPALILCDAITALSTEWEDEYNQMWPEEVLDPKVGWNPSTYCTPADDTTVNSAIFSGSTAPNGDDFQATGGVQNFIRYHEYWGGCKFEMNGSLACLWASEQEWRGKNTGRGEIKPKYRKFPTYRYFYYDDKLQDKAPPGFANFYAFNILNWKKIH